jgi:predicted RNA binding protein YcfA (HicA-like mRNA interferase family)
LTFAILLSIRFNEATTIAEAFGFRLDRISGSHHNLIHPDLPELVNLQNVKNKAKPYQIKQLLKIIEKYNPHMENDE